MHCTESANKSFVKGMGTDALIGAESRARCMAGSLSSGLEWTKGKPKSRRSGTISMPSTFPL